MLKRKILKAKINLDQQKNCDFNKEKLIFIKDKNEDPKRFIYDINTHPFSTKFFLEKEKKNTHES